MLLMLFLEVHILTKNDETQLDWLRIVRCQENIANKVLKHLLQRTRNRSWTITNLQSHHHNEFAICGGFGVTKFLK